MYFVQDFVQDCLSVVILFEGEIFEMLQRRMTVHCVVKAAQWLCFDYCALIEQLSSLSFLLRLNAALELLLWCEWRS